MHCANLISVVAALACLLVKEASTSPRGTRKNCHPTSSATYNLTFIGLWTRAAFPKMYPLYRPPAQWSLGLGRSHSKDYKMWSLDSKASKSVKEFAETGKTTLFQQEAQGYDGIYDVFNAPALPAGSGQSSVSMTTNAKYPLVSFMSKIVPSPDWFVGIDSLSLCQDGDWLQEAFIELDPTDAGTDKGFTFTAPNWASKPQENIFQITSTHPDHPASSFYYPKLKSLPPIARLHLNRLAIYDDKEITTKKSTGPVYYRNNIVAVKGSQSKSNGRVHQKSKGFSGKGRPSGRLGGSRQQSQIPDQLSLTALDCEVSEWGAWGPCSKSCGYGKQIRHRFITVKAQNSGQSCPPLQGDKLCGSMRNCKWNHFSMFKNWPKRG